MGKTVAFEIGQGKLQHDVTLGNQYTAGLDGVMVRIPAGGTSRRIRLTPHPWNNLNKLYVKVAENIQEAGRPIVELDVRAPTEFNVKQGNKLFLLGINNHPNNFGRGYRVFIEEAEKPQEVPLSLTVDGIITPAAWAKAQNPVTLTCTGTLERTGTSQAIVREATGPGGTKILQIYTSARWDEPVTLTWTVETKLKRGESWTDDATIDDCPAIVETKLVKPRLVVQTSDRKETTFGPESLTLSIPLAKQPDPEASFNPSEQYNAYVSLLIPYESIVTKTDKTGRPLAPQRKPGQVRFYLMQVIVERLGK
jgi:hypothetical protein